MSKEDCLEEFEKTKRDNRIQCSIIKKLEKDHGELSKEDMIESISPDFEEKKCFDLEDWMSKHPKVTYQGLCNFTSEELDELVYIIETTKGELFITFTMHSANATVEFAARLFSIAPSTFHDIVQKVVHLYYPIFIQTFIPKSIPSCGKEFKNFPYAVGAVDSTTIPFYCPSNKKEKLASWDAKNHTNGIKLQALVNPAGRAIHLNADYNAAVHDKKLFDVSGIVDFITVKRGKMTKSLPILADKGYAGIDKYLPDALIMKKGEENKEHNDALASDRQIVERYVGRMKMSWNILFNGFRGERNETMKTIILGLASLTNFLIDKHPLTKEDDLEIENNEIAEQIKTIENKKIKFPRTNHNPTRLKVSDMLPKKPRTILAPASNQFVGIQNQGFTCHLNATLQFLFSIPELVQIVERGCDSGISPLCEIGEMFNLMSNAQNAENYAVTIFKLTNAISAGFLLPRDLFDTLTDMITFIDANIKAFPDISFSVSGMYVVNHGITGQEYGMFNIKENSISVQDQILKLRSTIHREAINFGKLILVEV